MGNQLDQRARARIDQADDDPRRHHKGDNDERVIPELFARRPGDLLQLMIHHLEAVRDPQPQIFEKATDLLEEIRLCSLICHAIHTLRLSRFSVARVLLAEAAIFVHFQTIRIVLLVLNGVIIALLAFVARQRNLNPLIRCHPRHLPT